VPDVSDGALIAAFVIMLAVSSWCCWCPAAVLERRAGRAGVHGGQVGLWPGQDMRPSGRQPRSSAAGSPTGPAAGAPTCIGSLPAVAVLTLRS